ncbi:RiPP maturation radical SAM C-methyltransferase [Reyranella sp.]|uniref:RiPP maturation radical SAM C-methyltransferase n=2 Tax=Reyranella sp. TaxID=1929291 RepID=UPI003D1359AD
MRVVLVNMPWGALERPALGISLLKAGLVAQGVACEVRYLNMLFADLIGAERCRRITHDLPHIAFIGEWLFTEALYGPDAARDALFVERILRRDWRLSDQDIADLLGLRPKVEEFLSRVLDARDWAGVDLAGFTSTFEQNIASLALAARLKERHPHLRIAFGGANWEAAMGEELHRAFPAVDFAISGEADIGFPMLVQALQAKPREQRRLLAAIPGLVWRDRGRSVANGGGAPVKTMDELPIPDFGDYFDARERSQAAAQVAPVLLFETSRGCWWGAKSHCTFCGLNGHTIAYRSKSPGRVLDELGELIGKWPCPTLEAVDNILDMKYFDTVLPTLEKMDLPGPVFYEVKANMKRHHVAALRRAHVLRIQPGIESLSDHVLKLMGKGTTGLRNIQLLKWCREYRIAVDWNLLYGFPGETDADYEAIMDVLPRIRHLQLPGACGPIRLDRFSPYFQRPEQFGIKDVRPMPVYRILYPIEGLRHERIAYYFHFSYEASARASPKAHAAARLAEELRDRADDGSLRALPHRDGGLHLADTRARPRTTALKLSAFERCIVMRIDEVSSVAQVMDALAKAFPMQRFAAEDVRAFLDELVDLDMALTDGNDNYLGLALMPAGLRPELEAASRRMPSTRSAAPTFATMFPPMTGEPLHA